MGINKFRVSIWAWVCWSNDPIESNWRQEGKRGSPVELIEQWRRQRDEPQTTTDANPQQLESQTPANNQPTATTTDHRRFKNPDSEQIHQHAHFEHEFGPIGAQPTTTNHPSSKSRGRRSCSCQNRHFSASPRARNHQLAVVYFVHVLFFLFIFFVPVSQIPKVSHRLRTDE